MARAEFESAGGKGHHVRPIAQGGEALPGEEGMAFTGESRISRAELEANGSVDLSFYHQNGYGKEGAKMLDTHQPEPGGIFRFGNNQEHTDATRFWNKVRTWRKASGLGP